MRIAVLALLTCAICIEANAQPTRSIGDLITGRAAKVVDGSTFDIGRERIRLWGIDAPQRLARCTTSGRKWRPARGSAAALKDCLRGTAVTCRVQKIEHRLGKTRFVSECWRDKDKEDVAACMVGSGWATDWPGYSGGHYAQLEDWPKGIRRGLWECDGGPPTRRWCKGGADIPCEQPAYKPRGP